MRPAVLAVMVVVVAGCGGGGTDAPDARPGADAPADDDPDAAGVVDAAPDPDPDARDPDAAVVPPDAALPPDARPDATPVLISVVPCAGATIAVELTTSVTSYFPATMTIGVGDVIRFAPNDPHDVMAGTPAAPEPTWFAIAGNDPQCIQFDEAGAFPFFCTAHPSSMIGLVTVEP